MEKNKSEMKIMAKIIYYFSLIAKIATIIGGVSIIICMVVLPIFINRVGEVTDSTIEFNKENYRYELNEDTINININNNELVITGDNLLTVKEIRNIFRDSNGIERVFFVESFFAIILVLLSITYLVFNTLTKLFKNIANGETPFTKDNVKLLRQVGKYMIIVATLPIILMAIFKVVFGINHIFEFSGVDLMYILVIFALAYVFEYGYQLQEDVDGIL